MSGKGRGEYKGNKKYNNKKHDGPRQNERKGGYGEWRPNQKQNHSDRPKFNPGIPDQDQEENDEYIRFIASTLKTEGLEVDDVEVGEINPVSEPEPVVVEGAIPVDSEFWMKLDSLDATLRTKGFIALDEDGERQMCTLCSKSFSTMTSLLRHIWDNHQDYL